MEGLMPKARILVVEDERIIAEDIRRSLLALGYAVPAVCTTPAEALRKAEQHRPDLVLMDIVLSGGSGIEAGYQIHKQFRTPIVFLTANANQAIVEQAKKAEPYGYILKPFQERELESVIELSLHRHMVEEQVRRSEAWLSTTLAGLDCAVIGTDADGNVAFLNQRAAALIGRDPATAMRCPLAETLFLRLAGSGGPLHRRLFEDVLQEDETIVFPAGTQVVHADGTALPVTGTAAPIKDTHGNRLGVVVILQEIAKKS
jgi:PAS domain S-box-containing protein